MIQPTAFLNSTASTQTLAPVATGEVPAFDLSLAMPPEAAPPSVQPLAATGKALPPVALAAGSGVLPVDLAAPATPATFSSAGQAFLAETPRLPADAVPAVAVSKISAFERLTPVVAVTADTATPGPSPAPVPFAAPVEPMLLREPPARRLAAHRESQPNGDAAAIDAPVLANVPDDGLARLGPESTAATDAPTLDQARVAPVGTPLPSPTVPLADAMATGSAPIVRPGTATSDMSVTEPASPGPGRADRSPDLSIEQPARPRTHEALPDASEPPRPDTLPSADPRPLAPVPQPTLPLAVVVPEGTPAPLPGDVSHRVDSPPEPKAAGSDIAPVATPSVPTPAAAPVPDTGPVVVQRLAVAADRPADPRTVRPAGNAGPRSTRVEGESPRGLPAQRSSSDQGADGDSSFPTSETPPPVTRVGDRILPESDPVLPPAQVGLATASPAVASPVAARSVPLPVAAEQIPASLRRAFRAEVPAASPIAAATPSPAVPPAQPVTLKAELTTLSQAALSAGTIRPVAASPERPMPAMAAPTRAATALSSPVAPRAELPAAAPIDRSTVVVATPALIVGPPQPAPRPLAADAPTPVAPIPAAIASPIPSPTPEGAPAATRAGGGIEPPARPAEIAPRIALPISTAPPLVAGATAPAFRLFAAAIHAARADESDRAASAAATPVTSVDQSRPILAVASADRAPLDMADRRWPHAMVERIERLQEQASATRDAASTSIRLVPDALGAIDVAVRRDGDTVRVHFNAENAQTRTLIAEAQPRLQELAEAKGIRLAQANVGAGTDGQAQRQPAPPTPTRSAPASAPRDDEPAIEITDRVA